MEFLPASSTRVVLLIELKAPGKSICRVIKDKGKLSERDTATIAARKVEILMLNEIYPGQVWCLEDPAILIRLI
jgi:hypothetical protein